MVSLALEGAAARWMITLHNANAPELRNLNCFMTVLRWQFKDLVADQKARGCIRTIRQERRLAAEYTKEFWDLACCLDWPEDILVSCFEDGLNDNLYTACVMWGVSLVSTTGVC